jgi:structural maintenance of chromosome 2
MQSLEQTIADLKAAVGSAKEKQKAAKDECKRLEKDMDEFSKNKDGKIDELKVCCIFWGCDACVEMTL